MAMRGALGQHGEYAMKIEGNCHCGQIRYEAEIDPDQVLVCHCTDCQTLSGSAFRTVAFTIAGGFRLIAGTPKIYVKTADSGARRQQAFCPECGSPIYASSDDDGPKIYGIRLGTSRQRDLLMPRAQYWCGSALPWVEGLASVPKIGR
jgi:hypothetical protein